MEAIRRYYIHDTSEVTCHDSVLEDIDYVTNGSPMSEAYMRTRLNLILISCIAAEKRLDDQITSQAANTDDNWPLVPSVNDQGLMI
jgi:hypothetical protein